MDIQNVLGAHFMLYSQITTHLRHRGELLLSGDIDGMLGDFVFPLPIFLNAHRLLIQSPDQARLIFGHLRDAYLDRGVVSLRPSISAVDLPRGGRFRVWADWQEIALPVEGTRVSQAIYYCRMTALGLQVEMINYAHVSMPELNRQFAALALSA
jgi:hypothetical protein